MTYWYRVESDAPPRRPVILFLHGAGEAGGDRDAQTAKHGPWEHSNPAVGAELREWTRIGPHIPNERGVWNPAQLTTLAREVFQNRDDVLPNELALIGLSRGGRGALELAAACPAEIQLVGTVVFCPERVEDLTAAIDRAPVVLFHSEADTLVKLTQRRRAQYDALRARDDFHWVNVHPSWTLGNTYHNCWTHVLAHGGVYAWLRGLRTQPGYGTTKRLWPDWLQFAGVDETREAVAHRKDV